MQIIPGNAQHIGSRKEQQDDFGFSDIDNVTFINHGGVLAVIADGMGGLARGREASLIAKQTMLQEYDRKIGKENRPPGFDQGPIRGQRCGGGDGQASRPGRTNRQHPGGRSH